MHCSLKMDAVIFRLQLGCIILGEINKWEMMSVQSNIEIEIIIAEAIVNENAHWPSGTGVCHLCLESGVTHDPGGMDVGTLCSRSFLPQIWVLPLFWASDGETVPTPTIAKATRPSTGANNRKTKKHKMTLWILSAIIILQKKHMFYRLRFIHYNAIIDTIC